MIINVDSPDRAFNAQPALEDAPQGAYREAYAPPEGGIPIGGSPGAERVVVEAPLEVAITPSFLSTLASVGT